MCQALRFLAPYAGREPIIEMQARPDPTVDLTWDGTCACPTCSAW